MMELTVAIVALALALLGIFGCIVPILPGVLVAYAGYVCLYFCEGSDIGFFSLFCYGYLAIALTIVDYILPSYFSKKFGGSKAGRRGATLGMLIGVIIGFIWPIIGLICVIIGPFTGAVIGEIIHDKENKKKAFIVGLGAFISFFIGTSLKLVYALIISCHIFYIAWDIARTEILHAYNWIVDWCTTVF